MLQAEADVAQTLERIVKLAVDTIDAADDASVTIVAAGTVSTRRLHRRRSTPGGPGREYYVEVRARQQTGGALNVTLHEFRAR